MIKFQVYNLNLIQTGKILQQGTVVFIIKRVIYMSYLRSTFVTGFVQQYTVSTLKHT